MTPAPRSTASIRPWLAAIGAVASLQILLGLAGIVAGVAGFERPRLAPSEIPDFYRFVAVVSFSGLAWFLLLGALQDRRVSLLGTLFLVLAVFYASPPIESLALALPPGWARVVRLVGAVRVDAVTPALVWIFFRDFPRVLELPLTRRVVSGIVWTCAIAALFLIAANLALAFGADWPLLRRFDRSNPASQYWTVVFGLLVPAPGFILWRVRHAPEDERRRVRWFASGLALAAIAPLIVVLLPTFSSAIEDWFRQGLTGVRAVQALVLATVVGIAANTAYAVAVRHVLEIRAVLRKAAQYTVARGATATLAALPFAILGALLYRHRGEAIGSLFTGAESLLVFGLLAIGVVLASARRYVMTAIDRLLFRETYDARRILVDVAERSRATQSIDELAKSLVAEIDRALHLESLALLILDAGRDAFVPVSGTIRMLARSSAVLSLFSHLRRPVLVGLERRGAALHALSQDDRQWLADGAVEVLVPLVGSGDEILGLLALGAKKSELSFSREDLLLLSAVGAAAGIGIENRLLHESTRRRLRGEAPEAGARECASCGWVGDPGTKTCPVCSASPGTALLPRALFGKFRLERRIGAGAMGIVYLARDLDLDRELALKTLPETSPEDSVRLRREARAMAAVRHPNLALIFGVESWHGTPILLMEYLAGGTLAERISRGALPIDEALDVGAEIADVLTRLHDSGLLHRDVKPSNVGFTDDGIPKLLDFGLARIAGEANAQPPAPPSDRAAATQSGFLGTPLYMSPEALIGGRSDPTFDLWSLSVVIFEAIAGRHPFEQSTISGTLQAIRDGRALDLRKSRPECSDAVVELFARALAADRARRPSTARELGEWFRDTRRARAA